MVAVVQLYTDERRNGKICRARRASRRARISRATRSSPHSGLRSVSTVLSSPGYRTSVDEVKLVPNNLLLRGSSGIPSCRRLGILLRRVVSRCSSRRFGRSGRHCGLPRVFPGVHRLRLHTVPHALPLHWAECVHAGQQKQCKSCAGHCACS